MRKTKPIILQPAWNVPANIHAYITTSIDNFNLATHVDDNSERVLANRKILNEVLPSEPNWLNQVHSTKVFDCDLFAKNHMHPVEADAGFSLKRNTVCLIMTADCLPILLTNKKGKFVAAIHAGWRGLNNGVIENTVAKLNKFVCEDMLAFIGPAICQSCFEISAQVRDEFLSKDLNTKQFFTIGNTNDKYHANLRKIAEYKLVNLGLIEKNISNKDICTKCNTNWFFSYRANPKTGRIATMIWKD